MIVKFWAVTLFLILGTAGVKAVTVNAATSSYADVNTALGSCSDGDTLHIPTGTSDWASTLTISKAIVLEGNGTNNTIIQSGVAHGASLIVWNLVANKPSRMTAIQFTPGSVAANFQDQDAIVVNGVNTDARTFRCDHCYFNALDRDAFILETVLGVCDHCIFVGKSSGVAAWVGYVKGSSWNGTQGVNNYGDGAWAAADNFGSTNFFFFEDCHITNAYNLGHVGFLDAQAGGRYVVRNCTIYKGSAEGHGMEAQRERSTRAVEVYNNTFADPNNLGQSTVGYYRGGVQLWYSNTISGYSSSANIAILNNRSQDAIAEPFGGSDGRNPWDVNSGSNPFATGTASSVGALTVSDNTKSWTVNQWVGYTVRRTSGKTVSSMTRSGSTVTVTTSTAHGFTSGDIVGVFGANEQAYNSTVTVTVTDTTHFTFTIGFTPATPATGTIKCAAGSYFSDITANTATQLTFRASLYYSLSTNYSPVFVNGDTFEINKVTHSMDMVGRSGGSDLAGADSPAVPGGWNDQTTGGSYEWQNTREAGANVDFNPTQGILVAGTHYNNDTVKPGYVAQAYPHYLVTGSSPSSPSVYGLTITH